MFSKRFFVSLKLTKNSSKFFWTVSKFDIASLSFVTVVQEKLNALLEAESLLNARLEDASPVAYLKIYIRNLLMH